MTANTLPADPNKMLCEREGCRHPSSWHRLDDSTNISPAYPAAEFRCIGYDCEAPGRPTGAGCVVACPDFLPPPEWIAYFEELP